MDKVQQAWSHSYAHSRAFYWVLTFFLLLVVAVQPDSILRDFVLLFGIILLGAISTFREFAIKQVLFWLFYQNTKH